MAARMLGFAIRRSARASVEFRLNMTATGRYYFSENLYPKLETRSLYTKVLDKDTNWSTQRAVNKKQKEEPNLPQNATEIDFIEKETPFDVYKPKSIEASEVFQINKDADVFGTANLNAEEDPGDLAEEEYISNLPEPKQRLSHIQYVRLIKQHLMAKELQEAINILEKRMKKDRVKPETYTYNLVISACAKAGYTRKAFSLFTKMRQRGLRVTGGTYTSLFNACANAPSGADGLGRAHHLREIMLEKGVEPNVKNYNAMIKAYGRWGDVKTAYQLADEMKEKKIHLTAETYNFLLQACASDAEYGFRHCLLTWHKMLKQGFKPDYYSFNMVLRCARDCRFGDLETMQKVLQEILGDGQTAQLKIGKPSEISSEYKLQIEKGSAETKEQELNQNSFKSLDNPFKERTTTMTGGNPFQSSTTESKSLEKPTLMPPIDIKDMSSSSDDGRLELPNLLVSKPHLGSMLAISEVKQSHERFLLLGGINGFLDLMKQNNITPDIETFTMMLEVIPPTYAAEKQILSFIRRIGLKADIDFFNVLIKKRSMRFDYEGAKEVLSMVQTAGLRPDIVTYGVLALGCRTQEESRELLQEMRDKGIRMNIQILGAMLRQGCAQRSFPYICEIMQISLDENIKPNEIFLRHLHKFHTQCARAIDARHPNTKTKDYKKQHAKFCDKLRLYNEEHGIAHLKLEDAIKAIKDGPYQQYKEEKIEGIEPLKHLASARKQKIRKYIKKIKIANLRDDDNVGIESSKDTKQLSET